MSIGDRLARLLFIVPYVMHRDGVLVSELAEKLAPDLGRDAVLDARVFDEVDLPAALAQGRHGVAGGADGEHGIGIAM